MRQSRRLFVRALSAMAAPFALRVRSAQAEDSADGGKKPELVSLENVHIRGPEYDVMHEYYGARCDGKTDDAAAIQRAISDAASALSSGTGGGAVVRLGKGVHRIDREIQILPYVRVIGRGCRASILSAGPRFPTSTPVVVIGDGSGSLAFAATLEHAMVDCSHVDGSVGVYSTEGQEGSGVFDCVIQNHRNVGVLLDGAGRTKVSALAVRNTEVYASRRGSSGNVRLLSCGNVSLENLTLSVEVSGGGSFVPTPFGVHLHNSSVHMRAIRGENMRELVIVDANSTGSLLNLVGKADMQQVVRITRDFGGGLVIIDLHGAGAPIAVSDDFTGRRIGQSVPFYAVGQDGPTPATKTSFNAEDGDWYVRGDIKGGGDLDFVGGYRSHHSGFQIRGEVLDSLSRRVVDDVLTPLGRPMLSAGSITGLIAQLTASRSSGSLTVTLQRSSDSGHSWSDLVGPGLIIRDSVRTASVTFPKDLNAGFQFAAGDWLRVLVSTSSDPRWSPTANDLYVTLILES